jgi:hypothetical protein
MSMSYEEIYSTIKTASGMAQAANMLIESVSREDAFTCYIDVFQVQQPPFNLFH